MIVWLGGSFDPVHEGHLDLAKAALAQYHPSRVLLVPAAQNPLKKSPGASAEARLKMLELALAECGEPKFQILETEVHRTGPSYTVDSIAHFLQTTRESLALLMGNEVFAGLPKWREPHRLLTLANLIVATRENSPSQFDPVPTLRVLGFHDARPAKDLPNRYQYHGGARWLKVLNISALPVSATQLRQTLADASRQQNAEIPRGIQRSVWQFIKENQLYAVSNG